MIPDLSTFTGSAGAVGLTLLGWACLSYAVSPTVTERLLHNGGEIATCQANLRAKTQQAMSEAVANVPKPAPMPDVGKTFSNTIGTIFSHLPNAQEFMDMYGSRIENYGRQFEGPIKQKFDAARAEYDEAIANIRRVGERDLASAGSACECRARAVINSPDVRGTLSWYVGTLGFVSASPIGDWQSALYKPEIIAQCGGVS